MMISTHITQLYIFTWVQPAQELNGDATADICHQFLCSPILVVLTFPNTRRSRPAERHKRFTRALRFRGTGKENGELTKKIILKSKFLLTTRYNSFLNERLK